MEQAQVIQGRITTRADVQLVRDLIEAHSAWNRSQLSRELCRMWDWSNAAGQMKDMACRSWLLKLERQGLITLPEKQGANGGPARGVPAEMPHRTDPIAGSLSELTPVTVTPAAGAELKVSRHLLHRYHYLGHRFPVGQNICYLCRDREGRLLSCLLFGSAAWKCGDRDRHIGWSSEVREQRVNLITNNTRFLILPWVRVAHLASHLLSQVSRRIAGDWEAKYGHRVYLLETFVEQDRFRGTCYQAANWIRVGATAGRSRNDRHHQVRVPVKDVYLYPLVKDYREVLQA